MVYLNAGRYRVLILIADSVFNLRTALFVLSYMFFRMNLIREDLVDFALLFNK